ncbi:MAG TPA: VOC family protein [Microthrixaceae bacterium]|jgi:methylmalonyl-CoA/ethylmalonyl-CoA epimerase|nr:VOC family protein [Microthrixaceae bacterium]
MGIQARNPNEDNEDYETSFSGEPIDEAFDGGLDAAVLTEIDHIAIVVEDLDEAIAEHRDTFGVLVEHREELHGEGYEVAFLTVGGSTIQLISPTSEDSEFAEFLAEGGPGLHHIGYRVDDVAAATAALVASGREVLDEEPVAGPRESKVAFVHPDAAFGVLVQLVER